MRVLSCLVCVLIAAGSVAAQEFSLRGPATYDPTANSSEPRTYTGCIVRDKNGFVLKTIAEHTFDLTSERPLESYAGEEVRIYAYGVNPNDPSSAERSITAADPKNMPATLAVEYIEKVAAACAKK